MDQMTFGEAKLRLDRLGYALRKKHPDGFTYYTLPQDAGSFGYFNHMHEVEEYIKRVESMRQLWAELGPVVLEAE
jgi:hypothetical protein